MPEESAAKINAAIRSCLDQCYGTKSPLAHVGHFISQLQKDPTWRKEEVEEVQAAVLKMLSLIVERPAEE